MRGLQGAFRQPSHSDSAVWCLLCLPRMYGDEGERWGAQLRPDKVLRGWIPSLRLEFCGSGQVTEPQCPHS